MEENNHCPHGLVAEFRHVLTSLFIAKEASQFQQAKVDDENTRRNDNQGGPNAQPEAGRHHYTARYAGRSAAAERPIDASSPVRASGTSISLILKASIQEDLELYGGSPATQGPPSPRTEFRVRTPEYNRFVVALCNFLLIVEVTFLYVRGKRPAFKNASRFARCSYSWAGPRSALLRP